MNESYQSNKINKKALIPRMKNILTKIEKKKKNSRGLDLESSSDL